MDRLRGLIAIPAYNEEITLPIVLESLKKHKDLDVLVVNDGSTDGTEQALKNFTVLKIKHAKNKGYSNT